MAAATAILNSFDSGITPRQPFLATAPLISSAAIAGVLTNPATQGAPDPGKGTTSPAKQRAVAKEDDSNTDGGIAVDDIAAVAQSATSDWGATAGPGGLEDKSKEDDAYMSDGSGSAPSPSADAVSVVDLLSSSDEEDSPPEVEAGPAPWPDPQDARCSDLYIGDPRLSADDLHHAETVLLPRTTGSRRGHPWAGWNESKVVARPEKGIYVTSGGIQCLWDGEWLNDEVRLCLTRNAIGKWAYFTLCRIRLQTINTILRVESIALKTRAADAPEPTAEEVHQQEQPQPQLLPNGAPYGAPRRVFIWDSQFLARLLQGGAKAPTSIAMRT